MIPDIEPDPSTMSLYVSRAYLHLTNLLLTTQAERHQIVSILQAMEEKLSEDLY